MMATNGNLYANGNVTSNFAYEVRRQLEQAAREDEEISTARAGEHDIIGDRDADVSFEEATLITAMMRTAFPTVPKESMNSVNRSIDSYEKDFVGQIDAREGPYFNQMKQFMHLVEACADGKPTEEQVRKLIKIAGPFYGILQDGEIAVVPKPDASLAVSFLPLYQKQMKEWEEAGTIPDITNYILNNMGERGKFERHVVLPRFVPGNGEWFNLLAGVGAPLHYARDTEGQHMFAKFIADTTGDDSEHVRVAMLQAMDTKGGIRKIDELHRNTIEDLISGRIPREIPPGLRSLAHWKPITEQIKQDERFDPQEAALAARLGRILGYSRHPEAERKLYSTTPASLGTEHTQQTIADMEKTVEVAKKIQEDDGYAPEIKDKAWVGQHTAEVQLSTMGGLTNARYPIEIVVDHITQR